MADRLSCTAGHRTEAADFAVASGKPIAQVAADLGINEKILGRWVTVRKKELANHPVAAAAAKTETAEMRAARKCMRELELAKANIAGLAYLPEDKEATEAARAERKAKSHKKK